MGLKQAMGEMLSAVELELKHVMGTTTSPDYPELRGMLTYHMGWEGEGAGVEAQGKRIRPLMVLLCAQAVGADWHTALPAAAAVELLHNFSLIHDDIQDHSPRRRGRPTVWTKWGIEQAINAGDVMFIQSFRALSRLEQTVSAQVALEAYDILQRTCLSLTLGQYLDMSYESKRGLSLQAYWPMIRGKTSALLGSCAELGALTGGVTLERRAAFCEFGISLGLAFQVLDDWLGIWGDAQAIGKSIESDLVSGKKTLPVLYALEQNGAFAWRWMNGSIFPEDIPEVVRLLDECKAGEYTLAQAAELTRHARQALVEAVPVTEDAALLNELAEMLLRRNK